MSARRAIVIFMMLAVPTVCAAQSRQLTRAEAELIARASFTPHERAVRGFTLEGYPSKVPGFYAFEALWENPQEGSAIVGHRVVSLRTGDVWEAALCGDKIETPALRPVQADVRRRIGLPPARYRRITPRGEYCPWLGKPVAPFTPPS